MNALHAHSGNTARILYSAVSSSELILANIDSESKLIGNLSQIIDFYKESSFPEKAARMTFYPANAAEAIQCLSRKVRVVYNNKEYDARKASYLNLELMKLSITESEEEALEIAKKVVMRSLENFPMTSVEQAANRVAIATNLVSYEKALGFGEWYLGKVEERVLNNKAIKTSKTTPAFAQSEMTIEMMLASEGLIIDSSSTGSGKTLRNIEFAIEAMKAGRKVGIICHRISIASLIHSNIPDSVLYQDAKNPQELANARCLVIVVNSISYSNFFSFLTECNDIILEEGKQLLDHIATIELPKEVDRNKLFEKLNAIIKKAKTVVFTDADSNNNSISYLRKIRKDITLLTGKTDFSHVNINISSHDETLFKLYEAAKDDKKFMLACDSIKTVTGISQKLTREVGLKVLAITSENSLDAAQRAFILNPNAEAEKYDAVIYSPVITSTLSLTNPRFSMHFGLFSGVVDSSIAFQMLRRNRPCTEFFVGVMKNRDIKPEEISVSSTATEHEMFVASVTALGNYEKNHISQAIYFTAKHLGFTVNVSEVQDQKTFGNSIFKSARKVENESFANTMLETTARTCSKEQESHQEISNQAQRAAIENTFGKSDLTLEDIKAYKRGGLTIHVKNVELLQKTKAECQLTDAREINKMARDRQNLTVKNTFFNEIFSTLNINPEKLSGTFTVEQCNKLMTSLRSNSKEFNKIGLYAVRALKIGEVLKSQTRAVNALLKEFGLEIVEAGEENRIMTYKVSQTSKELILGCVARRKTFVSK